MDLMITVLLIVSLFVLLGSGVWIGIALAGVAWIGMELFSSRPAGDAMAVTIWGSASSWTLTALPLFVWMGEILFRTRLSEDMFKGLAPWLSRIPGRLLHTNIIGCTIFAAVSGSSAATCATIGKMTLPELKRRGYPEDMTIGTLIMVLLGIFGRLLDFQVRGTDAYAGYFMAGSGFLALAHTLTRGEHIRVTLILEHAGVNGKRWLERWSLGVAVVLTVAFAWFSSRLAWQSHAFHDISTGNDATPLWIPQLSMAAGNVILAIAFLDLLLAAIYGGRAPAARAEEPAHVE